MSDSHVRHSQKEHWLVGTGIYSSGHVFKFICSSATTTPSTYYRASYIPASVVPYCSASYDKHPSFGNTSLKRQQETSSTAISRHLFLPSISGLWDALTGGGNSAREAMVAIRRGMLLFREGDVSGSLLEFDKAIELDPRQKQWGAEQFLLDVATNPNDTEESIWCFLCESQLYGVDEARKHFLEVGTDPCHVMQEVYSMFKDGGDPETLVSKFKNGRDNEYFYAFLYADLFYESQN